MKLGIVGLPNVGKSTLFNSLTKAGALSANYPFATIDPNVGIVSVPDERIVKLGELYHTKKVTPATIEFVDIAGLVKGASKGEGLGNQFLANIREVDAIVHVVRCFEDTNIIHVDGSIDPARDIETINLELIFSDIEILDRRIAKISKQARMDKTLAKELELGGYIVSGAYSADNKSTLAIFEPTGNGDYKFSTSTNRNSDEIIVGGVAINGEWYDLIWFNGAKTEYAEITYTINGQVQDTLRYSTDDMDIISIKNPEKEYSIHVVYYDNDGNKYE